MRKQLGSLLRKGQATSAATHLMRTPVAPGVVSAMRAVPRTVQWPEYATTGEPRYISENAKPRQYTEAEIVKARRSASLARKMLEYACALARSPGITTEEIDRLTHEEIVKHGAYPSPINYRGFPKAICTSVNEVVCHGIPDNRPLVNGDIISIDVSLFLDGMHGDNCATVMCGGDGSGDAAGLKLIDATKDALDEAVQACGPGVCLTQIGEAIHRVALRNDLRIVHEFCGHGTGEVLHMPPFVRHFRNNFKQPLLPGMVFTIEPILVEGSRRVSTWDDGWTVFTLDGGRGAQFEHEVLITPHGAEVITKC